MTDIDNPFADITEAADPDNPFAETVTPEPESSNPLVNLGKGLYKGTVYGIPEQLGKAAQFLGVGGQTAKDIAKWGEEGIGKEEKGVVQQTGEMIPESIGVPIVSQVVGQTLISTGNPYAAAAGMAIKIGGRFITPALFGLAQAQTTKETAEEAGKEPGFWPLVTGGIEWAGETAANIALGRILGPFATIGKVAKTAIAKMSVTGAMKGTIGAYLKELALVTAPTEILTEMGQNYGEALAEKWSGIRPEAQPGAEAASAIAPTALMTALLGPFGRIAQRHVVNKQASILSEPINPQDPNANELMAMRMKVAQEMTKVIPEENAELRDQWVAYASQKIQNNLPIDIAAPLDSLSMQIETQMDELPEEKKVVEQSEVTPPSVALEEPIPPITPETAQITPETAPAVTSTETLPETRVETAPEEEIAPRPGDKTFIENKIRQLGTIEAVNKFYSGNDVVSDYARTMAPKILGVEKPKLSYEDFIKKYQDAFSLSMKYTPDQVGSRTGTDEMARLADEYPDYLTRFEGENVGGYRSRGLEDAVNMRKEEPGGSLANYDAQSTKEWLRGQTPPADGNLTLYRATPDGAEIKPGDYVTNSRQYAQDHITNNLGGKGKITSIKGTLDDLYPADGPGEFWYAPKSIVQPVEKVGSNRWANDLAALDREVIEQKDQIIRWSRNQAEADGWLDKWTPAKAIDEHYGKYVRGLGSASGKPLKKGETWRGRLTAMVERTPGATPGGETDPLWYQGQRATKTGAFEDRTDAFFTKDPTEAEWYAGGLSINPEDRISGGRVIAVRQSELEKRLGRSVKGEEIISDVYPTAMKESIPVDSIIKTDIPALSEKTKLRNPITGAPLKFPELKPAPVAAPEPKEKWIPVGGVKGASYRAFDSPDDAVGADVSMSNKPFGYGGAYEIEISEAKGKAISHHPGDMRGQFDPTKVTRLFYERDYFTDPTQVDKDLPILRQMFPNAEFVEVKLADDTKTRLMKSPLVPSPEPIVTEGKGTAAVRAKIAEKKAKVLTPEQAAKKKALMSIPVNQAVDFIIKNGYLNIENVKAISKQDAIRLNRRFFNRAPFGKMGSIARKDGKLGLDEVAAEFPQYFGTEQKNPDEHLLDILLDRGIVKSIEGKTDAELGAAEYEHYINKHGITGEDALDALSGEDQERIEGISLDEIAGEAGLTEEERRLAAADAGEFLDAVAKPKEETPTPKGTFETGDLAGISAAETFDLVNPETEIGTLQPQDRGPKTAGMFEETKYGELGPDDAWDGMGDILDGTVRQMWKTKLEGFENESQRIIQENRDKQTSDNTGRIGRGEISIRRRLRDRRLFDEEVRGANQRNDRQRWQGVDIFLAFADTAEFKLGERHFASLGYQTVPVTRLPWGMAVNTDTKVVFMGEMGGDRFAYFMSHETSHILSAQGNEAVNAIKAAIDLSHPLVIKQREGYDWTDDYTRDEFAASIVGGVVGNESMLKGDQAKNIKAARETATNEGKPTGNIKAGPAYGFVQPRSPAFYSKLSQTIQGASFTKMPVPQLKAFLKGKQVTDAEIENITGALTGTVTKQQVLDEIKVNSTEFKDVILGGIGGGGRVLRNDDMVRLRQIIRGTDNLGFDTVGEAANSVIQGGTDLWDWNNDAERDEVRRILSRKELPTHFSQYVEPGAIPGTYREMFVTAPAGKQGYRVVPAEDGDGFNIQKPDGSFILRGPETNEPESKKIWDTESYAIKYGIPAHDKSVWSDGHPQYSDIQNPIVRIRYNEREVEGKRILFVEEIQGPSEANQEKMPEYLRKRIYDIGAKRVLALAKEKGFDGVAWTSGEMQAARYDLSKQIQEVTIKKWIDTNKTGITFLDNSGMRHTAGEFNDNELEGVVGKDLASKIIADLPKMESQEVRRYSGLDLKVGGEGLKTLYDRTLPAMFKKYGKERMGEIKIQTKPQGGFDLREDKAHQEWNIFKNDENYDGPFSTLAEAQNALKKLAVSVPFIPITDKTPEAYTMYGDVIPDKKLLTASIAHYLNPKTLPPSAARPMREFFKEQGAKEFKWWDNAFSIPFRFSQKYKEWERAWDAHVNKRQENRSEMTSSFIRTGEDFLNLQKLWRKEGLSRKAISDSLEKVERVISASDVVLHERLVALKAQIQGTKGEKQANLQKQITELQQTKRFSDAELKAGITDEYGDKIPPLNDREIKAYVADRKMLDSVLTTLMDHQLAMAFKGYKNKKWYNILLAATGMNLTREETQKLLDRKGLNKAAITRAETIRPDLNTLFDRMEEGITAVPADEIAAAGAKYEKLATKMATELTKLKGYIGHITGIKDQKELTELTKEIFSAYIATRPHLKEVKRLRNEALEWVGYAPRYRDQGKYKMRLVERFLDEDGNIEVDEKTNVPLEDRQVHSEMVNNEAEAKRLYVKMLDLYADPKGNLPPNHFIEYDSISVSPEAAFQGVNDVGLQKIFDDAMTTTEGKFPQLRREYVNAAGETVSVFDQLRRAGLQSIADQFKKRGAMRATIHRNQKYGVIKGYKERNLQRVHLNYVSAMSGLMTKQIAAADMLEILSEVKDPSMFSSISKWNREQLRNESAMDRGSAFVRSMAFTYMLGGLVKAPVINATQPFIVGAPELKKYMRANGVTGPAATRLIKSSADILRSNTTGIEKRLMNEMVHRGVASDQYIQSIFENLRGQFEEKFLGTMRMLALPFSKVEIHNRLTSIVALFRVAYPLELKKAKDKGLTGEEAKEAAYQEAFNLSRIYNDNVNYAYGKANRPMVIQTGDFTGAFGSSLYTFKAFPHNFLARQAELLSQGDFRTFVHTTAYMAVFGGLMGLPFFKDLFDWFEKEFGYSPINAVRKTLRGVGGKTLETFGISGLPAVLGANISGSLNIGLPWPIGSTNPEDSIFGVVGSLVKRVGTTGQAISRGDWERAVAEFSPEFIRAPITALRESEMGKGLGYQGFVTNPRGNVVYDETGKPISLSAGEMAFKAVGFNPTDYARKKEMNATVKRQEAWAAEQKANITEKYRVARIRKKPEATKEMMNSVRELNQKIRSRGIQNLVPLASVQRIVQSARQVKGAKERRETAYKRAEL